MKRALRKVVGVARTLCWTDHANFTRQQVLEDIEVKHLRWISEILSDGSELRSLSGRSAKLGDGFSRNPVNRDALLEQRTKDLQGMMGQFRAFDLEAYASDYPDESGKPVPWTVGDDAIPDRVGVGQSSVDDGALPVGIPVATIMQTSGVNPVVTVLHVCDYLDTPTILERTRALHREVSKSSPCQDSGCSQQPRAF